MDKWLNSPLAMRLVALALGTLLWMVVHFDPDNPPNNVASLLETKTIEAVKVQPYGLDDRNFKLVGLEPQTVRLTVRGTRSDLLSARPEDYRLQVDLSTATAGRHTMAVKVESLPRGIQLMGMSPGTVTVTIEALQTKEFEVQIRTSGTPAEGYKAGTPIVRPTNRVHVTLPEDQMALVDSVGAVIPIEGKKDAIRSKSVKLSAYDANGNVLKDAVIEPALLEVEVPITNPFKTVPLKFRFLGRLPAGLSIASFKPETEQVTAYGPQSALDALDFVEADVDLSKIRQSGDVEVPLKAEGPIKEISPAEVTVSIEVVLSETRTIEGLPIAWTGLADGLRARIVDPATGKADLTLQGAPAILSRLQPGDISVVADLNGRGPGTYTVPLVVNLPRFVEQTGGIVSVKVEITAADQPATAPPDHSSGGATGGAGGGAAGNAAANPGGNSAGNSTGGPADGTTTKP